MNVMKMIKHLFISLALLCLCGPAVFAASSTYTFTGTDSAGDPASASAMFITGNGTIQLTLNDLLSNPKDAGQLLSDIFFTPSGGTTSSASISSASGTPLTVASGGSYTIGSPVTPHWNLSSPSSGTLLLTFAGGPPNNLIIGTSSNGTYTGGTYSNANPSIAGNGPHNPFLESGVTFNLAVPGITAANTITSATFSFGTTAGDNHPGTLVPEADAITLFLLGTLLTGVGFRRRSFSKRQAAKI
jgi:hypothetical protein